MNYDFNTLWNVLKAYVLTLNFVASVIFKQVRPLGRCSLGGRSFFVGNYYGFGEYMEGWSCRWRGACIRQNANCCGGCHRIWCNWCCDTSSLLGKHALNPQHPSHFHNGRSASLYAVPWCFSAQFALKKTFSKCLENARSRYFEC